MVEPLKFVAREAEEDETWKITNAQIMLRRAVIELCTWLPDGDWEVAIRPRSDGEPDQHVLMRFAVATGTRREEPQPLAAVDPVDGVGQEGPRATNSSNSVVAGPLPGDVDR